MSEVKTYTCGNGDGMSEDPKGIWVEKKEYDKLKNYIGELFELAINNCRGLSHDELFEIVEKYE